MAAKGHIRKIEILKDQLIQENFTQIYDGYTGITKLIRGSDHFEKLRPAKEKALAAAGKEAKWDPYQEPLKGKFGHVFQVKISIDFTFDNREEDQWEDSNCRLEWWERPTKQYGTLNKNAWNQLYQEDAVGPINPIWDNWYKTVHEVKEPGAATVKILDRPSLAKANSEDRRALYFCLVAKCTPNCECGVGYKFATAIQGLSINEVGQKNFFFNAYPPGEFVSYDGHAPSEFQPPALILDFFS